MTTDYTHLNTFTVTPEDTRLMYANLPKIVHLEDPATAAMNDFATNVPLAFLRTELMMKARRAMEAREQHFVLATDTSAQVVGVLSLKHILGETPIKMIEENRVVRSEVLIRNVMTPMTDIPVIDLTKLQLAKVGHILTTLEHLKSEYLLVVESLPNQDKKSLRGIFLASDLNRVLGKNKQY